MISAIQRLRDHGASPTPAAQKAGLKTVPYWVREMSDEDAYMALALDSAQGEMHPLEEWMHAIGSGLSVRE
jgi:ParB-like chromosome segregation protein Spo0J